MNNATVLCIWIEKKVNDTVMGLTSYREFLQLLHRSLHRLLSLVRLPWSQNGAEGPQGSQTRHGEAA